MGGDDNVAEDVEIEMLMMKLNEAKMTGRLSSDSVGSCSSITDYSSVITCVSMESVLSEDEDFWSPMGSSFRKETTGSEFRPTFFQSQSGVSDFEMMKERFSRLLLGEDMSGSGQGVSTALAISNAITNLYAGIFGQLRRLEPLSIEMKEIWRREMDLLLSVCDHIVEMVPSYKTVHNGTKLEVMATKQRSDLSINLPALRKLDSMLLELLDGFSDTDFWYIDQGKEDVDTEGSELFAREKWWLPVPQIPKGGLSSDSCTQLERKRECAIQILRATMLINTDTLSEIDVPDSYFDTLPETAKACLGDQLYKLIASDRFSVECVFECLDFSVDHIVSDMVNRLESAIYLWNARTQSWLIPCGNSTVRSSSADAEKMELFSSRAEVLLHTMKHHFPHLPHTFLEATKIQCNKDVGKSILESYSRVLETLAYNIISRIDDVLSITTQPENFQLHSNTMTPNHHTVSDFYSRPMTRNHSRTASLTQTPMHSSKSDKNILPNKPPLHRSITKRVLSNLCVEPRDKHRHKSSDDSDLAVSSPRTNTVLPPSHPPISTHKRRNSSPASLPKNYSDLLNVDLTSNRFQSR